MRFHRVAQGFARVCRSVWSGMDSQGCEESGLASGVLYHRLDGAPSLGRASGIRVSTHTALPIPTGVILVAGTVDYWPLLETSSGGLLVRQAFACQTTTAARVRWDSSPAAKSSWLRTASSGVTHPKRPSKAPALSAA
jgi:hypothetical protein